MKMKLLVCFVPLLLSLNEYFIYFLFFILFICTLSCKELGVIRTHSPHGWKNQCKYGCTSSKFRIHEHVQFGIHIFSFTTKKNVVMAYLAVWRAQMSKVIEFAWKVTRKKKRESFKYYKDWIRIPKFCKSVLLFFKFIIHFNPLC